MNVVGIHMIFLPEGSWIPFKPTVFREAVQSAAEDHNVEVREAAYRVDHMHLLIKADDEGAVAEFISQFMQLVEEQGYSMSDKVHVTLLPPWHIEILSSFIRDQDRYHETRTVEDEIDEIFRPSAVEVN